EAIIRNVPEDCAVGSDANIVANHYTADHLGTGTDVAVVADDWSARSLRICQRVGADRNLLKNNAVFSNPGRVRHEYSHRPVGEYGLTSPEGLMADKTAALRQVVIIEGKEELAVA